MSKSDPERVCKFTLGILREAKHVKGPEEFLEALAALAGLCIRDHWFADDWPRALEIFQKKTEAAIHATETMQ